MKKMKQKFIIPSFQEIVSYSLIFLFVYAAVNKLADFEKFYVQLKQSPLLTSLAMVTAWIIPSLEIIISVLLSFPVSRLIGLYASFALMMLFTCYIIAIVNLSEHVPCSCGGILENMNWTQHLIFNICFVILTASAVLYVRKPRHEPKI